MDAIKLLSGWAAYSGGETLAVPSQVTEANAKMLVASGDAVEAELPKVPKPETAKPTEPGAEAPAGKPEPKAEAAKPQESQKERTKGRR